MQAKVSQTVSREHVERGIYKRRTRAGGLRYEVAFVDLDGRQRWRTVGTLREARQLRADLVSKVGRGERVASSRVTFAEYADAWLLTQEARLRPRTYSSTSRHCAYTCSRGSDGADSRRSPSTTSPR